jgi:TonB family protein
LKRYLVFSSGAHVLFLAGWLISGALMTHPRMSYYAIDLVSSLPAGGPTGSGGGAAAVEEAPKVVPPPAPPVKEVHKLPAKEVIQVRGKPEKPHPAPKVVPKKRGLNLKAALAALNGTGTGTGKAAEGRGNSTMQGAGGSGIVGDAGQNFPFPWYLKQIADELNKHWKPGQDFQEDMLCQVQFVIHRDGDMSDMRVEKPSGDSTFDQMAQRAVVYSKLPPLPGEYPEDTLRVHMKFVGKQQ